MKIIVAMTDKNGIGYQGRLPWRIKADMDFFRDKTTAVTIPGRKNAVIMGRKTWDSIPARFRPLADRENIVLSRKPEAIHTSAPNVFFVHNFKAVLNSMELRQMPAVPCIAPQTIESTFVIGGAEIYREALASPLCDELYVTRVRRADGAEIKCDVFMDDIPDTFERVECSEKQREGDFEFVFETYHRKEPRRYFLLSYPLADDVQMALACREKWSIYLYGVQIKKLEWGDQCKYLRIDEVCGTDVSVAADACEHIVSRLDHRQFVSTGERIQAEWRAILSHYGLPADVKHSVAFATVMYVYRYPDIGSVPTNHPDFCIRVGGDSHSDNCYALFSRYFDAPEFVAVYPGSIECGDEPSKQLMAFLKLI